MAKSKGPSNQYRGPGTPKGAAESMKDSDRPTSAAVGVGKIPRLVGKGAMDAVRQRAAELKQHARDPRVATGGRGDLGSKGNLAPSTDYDEHGG